MKTALTLVTCLSFVLMTNPTLGEASFPYEVEVGEGGTFARSGPGEKYYATERIPAGTAVEVWRHDPDGWIGIRPLEESFSLVSPDGLRYAADSDVAQVRGDKVVAWVGSNVEEIDQYKWQVRLMPGESVVIRGKAELQLHGGSPKRSLARIAPPSGEFRWIHQSVLTAEKVDRGVTNPDVDLAQFRVIVDDADAKNGPTRDSFVPRRTANRDRLTERTRPAAEVSSGREAKSLLTTKDFNQRLGELQIDLSLLVAQSPESWKLTKMVDEVSELADRGSSTLQRARAQRLLEQIEEFEDLKSRFVGLRQSDSLPVGTGTSSNDDPSTSSLSSELAPGHLFDGTGWLLPVHSSKQNAPPFALLDSEGRILKFVSPAPGLNLHRFLRKEIGIFGQKSSQAKFDKPHVIAHRVVDLARHRR